MFGPLQTLLHSSRCRDWRLRQRFAVECRNDEGWRTSKEVIEIENNKKEEMNIEGYFCDCNNTVYQENRLK